MMEDLIKAYEDRGVKFWVENGQLKFKAPSGTLNAEDKVKLRNVKEKLIEYYERNFDIDEENFTLTVLLYS